jgi:hypothetical protein
MRSRISGAHPRSPTRRSSSAASETRYRVQVSAPAARVLDCTIALDTSARVRVRDSASADSESALSRARASRASAVVIASWARSRDQPRPSRPKATKPSKAPPASASAPREATCARRWPSSRSSSSRMSRDSLRNSSIVALLAPEASCATASLLRPARVSATASLSPCISACACAAAPPARRSWPGLSATRFKSVDASGRSRRTAASNGSRNAGSAVAMYPRASISPSRTVAIHSWVCLRTSRV